MRTAADFYDQDIDDVRDGALEDRLRFREELFSADVTHSRRLAEDHRVSIGAGIRQLTVEFLRTASGFGREYNETRGDLHASWDWQVASDVRLTLGGNIGYLDGRTTTGVDAQPDARIAWTPEPDLLVWAGLSGNEEPDNHLQSAGTLTTRKSPELLAYEVGLRKRWNETFLLQLDAFVYDVDDQVSDVATSPGLPTMYVVDGETNAYGGELTMTWRPLDDARVTAWGATTQANSQHFQAGAFTAEVEVPRTRAGLTLGLTPTEGLELDSVLLYTEQHAGVPTWFRWDLRLGFRPDENTQVAAVAQNITDPHHPEYFYLEEVERGFYLLVSHSF
jgi:iron complex outermembrane receptor protein